MQDASHRNYYIHYFLFKTIDISVPFLVNIVHLKPN